MTTAEIRTYMGDGDDLAALVQRAWKQNFQGKKWFPLWDGDYFRWRLFDSRESHRELCLGAYEGTTLVGCIMAETTTFEWGGQPIPGSYSSWLSVDQECQSRGVALRLVEELRRRHLERGLRFSVGCTRTDRSSPARQFWDSLARRRPEEFQFWGPVRFWAKVLQPARVAAAGLTTVERWGAQALRLIPSWPGRIIHPTTVRSFQNDDADACLPWLQQQGSRADLRMAWTPSRLEQQFNGSGFPRTLISHDGIAPCGMINYHCLNWLGREEIRVALVDLFAGADGRWHQRTLLKAAEHQMRDENVDLVLMMSSTASPGSVLLSRGFVSINAEVELFGLFIDPQWQHLPPRTFHIVLT